MSRKKIKAVIIAVSVFYVIVAGLALLLLDDDKSVLANSTMAELLFGEDSGEKHAEVSTGSSEEDPNAILERWTEAKPVTEAVTEVWTEEETELVTEAPTETPTEGPVWTITEAVTEQKTEKPTETLTEEPTETMTEEVTEEPAEDPAAELPEFGPQADGKYYIFESINKDQLLLIRESGTKNSQAIGQLKPHSKGVVVEPGETWTRIYAKGTLGYCINEALEIREVTKEEFEDMVQRSGN